MPTFRVEGADRQSGEDVAYEVNAGSEVEARAQVESHMLVSSIVRVMESFVPPPTYSPPPLSAGASAPRSQPLRSQPGRTAPTYNLLNLAASACTALGIVAACLSLLVLMIGLYEMFTWSASRGGGHDVRAAAAGMANAASGISGILAGVFMVGAGQSMAALRDIAINSFRS